MKTTVLVILVLCIAVPGHVWPAGAAEMGGPPSPTPSGASPRVQEDAAPAIHDAFVKIIQGNFEEALKLADEAIALNPGDPDAHIARSLALSSLDDNEAALASADTALALNPEYGAAHFARGTALLRMGKGDQARESFKRACDLGETRGCKFLY